MVVSLIPAEGKDRDDTRPYLCIPYWTTPLGPGGRWDTGEQRPLPNGVIFYACESIRPGPYEPGQPLDVTVDIRNSGGGNATVLATVVVYWADPTVGFAKPNFFAATVVPVSPARTTPAVATSATLTATIPANAPGHICLVVSVSHDQDRAGTVCDPLHDRHWAQHNLQAVTVAQAKMTTFAFTAVNPFAEKKTFELSFGLVPHAHAAATAARFGVLQARASAILNLHDRRQKAPVADTGARVTLDPLATHRYELSIETQGHLGHGEGLPIEISLFDPASDDPPDPRGTEPTQGAARRRGRLIGSLGLVLIRPR